MDAKEPQGGQEGHPSTPPENPDSPKVPPPLLYTGNAASANSASSSVIGTSIAGADIPPSGEEDIKPSRPRARRPKGDPTIQKASAAFPVHTESSSSGNMVDPGYTVRRVKTYTIFEAELNQITILDGFAGLALSICFSAGTFFFGANWDLLLTAKLDPAVMVEANASRKTALVVAILFLCMAIGAVVWRLAMAQEIRKNSTPHVFKTPNEIRPAASSEGE